MWQPIYNALLGRFSGQRALGQACEQHRIERFFTFPNFERSAERVAEQLRLAGLEDVEVEDFPADGKTTWSGWRAMTAWDVESARLRMTSPRRALLADWTLKPASLVMYSGPCEVEAEVVEWNGELEADLSGKLPFTRHRINDVYPQMQRLGVTGILSDFIGTLPGVRDPFDLPDEVRWENSGLRPANGAAWGFMLTPRQGEMLRGLLRRDKVRIRAEIRSRVYDGLFKSATGVLRGAELPDEEVLFCSHLYEPGANDNASGVGVGLELARCLCAAIASGDLPRPRRTIRFLFNWEGYGLMAWFEKHRDRSILGGLNIDEIGVDQSKGRSVTHLFMPPASNASCIGDLVQHLCGEILSPQVRWKPVADRAEIINDTITSDPNINAVMPCLIQYPSRYYHSSGDVPETLSAEVMERFGLLSGTHLSFLANAGPREGGYLAQVAMHACRQKLHDAELRLLTGQWPFEAGRSRNWFLQQFITRGESLGKFGLSPQGVDAFKEAISRTVAAWLDRLQPSFPAPKPRGDQQQALDRARALIPSRATLGAPKAWGSLALTPEQHQEYRRVLYANNLDLLFHRLCYWADGRRTLLDIVDLLELEMDELQRDTGIARTSSGSLITAQQATQINLDAVLYIADLLIRNGYLRAKRG